MPIYGFECPSCGHSFDRLQKLSDPDPTECPACGAVGIRRQISAPSFRLAGSGWYETDFKKDGDRKRNLAGDGDGGAKADSAKTDTAKPDAAAGASATSAASKSDSAPAKPAASESKPAAAGT